MFGKPTTWKPVFVWVFPSLIEELGPALDISSWWGLSPLQQTTDQYNTTSPATISNQLWLIVSILKISSLCSAFQNIHARRVALYPNTMPMPPSPFRLTFSSAWSTDKSIALPVILSPSVGRVISWGDRRHDNLKSSMLKWAWYTSNWQVVSLNSMCIAALPPPDPCLCLLPSNVEDCTSCRELADGTVQLF